jgi:hypothetical protein
MLRDIKSQENIFISQYDESDGLNLINRKQNRSITISQEINNVPNVKINQTIYGDN